MYCFDKVHFIKAVFTKQSVEIDFGNMNDYKETIFYVLLLFFAYVF